MTTKACFARDSVTLLLVLFLAASGCKDDGRGSRDAGPADGAAGDDAPADAGAAADTGPMDAGRPDAAPDAGRDARPTQDGGGDGGGDGGEIRGCSRESAPADRARHVVIAHPFDPDANPDNRYRVLELSEAGELTDTGTTFRMGRATSEVIAFTPDGEIGVSVQEQGRLGVFRMNEDGSVDVLEEDWRGSFYAQRLVMSPEGDRVWVQDIQWRDNGGGIYEVFIDCDGHLIEGSLVAEAKLPYQLVPLGDGRAVIAAEDVLGRGAEPESIPSAAGDDAHLIAGWGEEPAYVGGADAWGDDNAIMTSGAMTADGRYLLLGDTSIASGRDNGVAVLSIDEDGLSPVQVLAPISDPSAIVTSPFGDTAIVVSGVDGDAIYALDYDPNDASAPFAIRGELTYAEPGPALPYRAVLVDRGALEGLVLVAENVGVRRVRFDGDGDVTDLGALYLGEGVEFIVGSIGVQP